jgi:thiosulfate reductase cytochrome b subunit
MKNILKENLARQVIHWLLLVVLVLYLLTGFGITEYRVVEHLTLGLLSKNLAFNIHNNLLIPFIVLLGLHIYQQTGKKSKV